MTGGNRRVGGEDAHVANAINIELLDPSGEALFEAPFQQAQRKQSRVALVHVERLDQSGIEFFREPEAAQSKYNFLGQAIALVAAVERVSQRAVVVGVLGEIGVEQINRNNFSGDAGNCVLPGANKNLAAFDLY